MDKDICCICLDILNENIKTLPCKHKFHITCLNQWILSNPTCPMCRNSISYPPQQIRQRNVSMSDPRIISHFSHEDLFRDIALFEPRISQYYDGLLDSREGREVYIIYNEEYDNIEHALRDFKIYAIFLNSSIAFMWIFNFLASSTLPVVSSKSLTIPINSLFILKLHYMFNIYIKHKIILH